MVERFADDGGATRIVIDTGPDLRGQLIAAGVHEVNAVIFTHSHADHVHGIDDLRAFWMSSRKPIPVFTDDATQARLEEGFSYCFRAPAGSSYPAFLKRNRIVAGAPFTIDGAGGPIELLPLDQVHGDIRSLGFRVGPVAYSCDFNDLPDETILALSGLDLWIVDALRRRPHPSHCSLDDAKHWIERLGPDTALLTHMTNELDYRTLRQELPERIAPAHDGLTVEFNLPS